MAALHKPIQISRIDAKSARIEFETPFTDHEMEYFFRAIRGAYDRVMERGDGKPRKAN
jgi:hypothetical protein